MHSTKRKCLRFLLLALQCVLYSHAGAQTEPTITRPLLGSEGKFKKDSISFVSDNAYFSNALPFAAIEQTHRIRNLVSVGIEEESLYYVQTDFSVTVTLNIKKYDHTHTLIDDDDKEFTINYKKGDTARYNAIQYLPFEGAYEVKVKILSIDSGSVTWPVSRVLRVDNQLTATRDYVFSCSATTGSLALTEDNTNKELTASWGDPHAGQTEYDLEWAWIDADALDDYKDGSGNFVQDKLFINNATRVTISGQSYNIPLMYDGNGRIFVRVRPAQLRYSGQRVEGTWTWQNSGSPVYYSYGGHEDSLNWQASTSFAEEGKRKTVVQYFDGTLRSRQTVTKDNTTNTTVVAESFYDYQGRPVIQILPAPTLSHVIEYSANFNRAINHNQYPKWVYDKLEPGASICGNAAMAFSTSSGSAKYYSPNNDDVSSAPAKYIPSSTGSNDTIAYPFTETRFTADGRIASQGGVGPTHQLGSGHETKYFYEVPAQEELDALFGTDAGEASHYFKNIVKDANGQYSVSYSDMHGRTVATALMADSPLQLDTLASKNKRDFTKQLIDKETNRVVGRSIISSKPLVVPMAGRYEFHYELDPQQLSLLSCGDTTICYDCLYNLKISITSDCNTTDGFPYVVVDSNFTIGQSLTAPVCTVDGKTTGHFDKTFVIESLPEGSYTISKVLSLSDSAQRIYRDSVFMKYDTCRSFQDFYVHEYEVLLAQSNCNITCESCKEAVGSSFTVFRQRFVTQSGLSEPLSDDIVTTLQASYKDALANCERICNAVDTAGFDAINSIRQTMLLDMTPPMGQYAKPDDLNNEFNIFRDVTIDGPKYKKPLIYTTGTPVTGTYRNEFGQQQLNPDPRTFGITQFANDFDPAWAEQLLPYHPEFCKLKTTLELLPSTYAFESKLLRTNTWTASKVEQYTTVVSSVINIVNKDPFFSGPGSGLKTEMINKMGDFSYPNTVAGMPSNPACSTSSSLHPSMWQLAQSAVFCINEAGDPCNPSSAQNLCLLGTATTPPVNPTTGCATDWDMAWRYFRTLYISYRKLLIARYVKSGCETGLDDRITNHGYKLRFVDYEHMTPGNMGLGDYTTLINELQAGNPNAQNTAHTMELQNYDSTCRGYADSWLVQLQECAGIETRWETPAYKTADSLYLVPLLVDICKKGSDPYHPLGSSSLAPGKLPATDGTHNFSNFPQVIAQFLSNIGITSWSSTCHPFLIKSPKPYDKQQAMTNGYVVTKPTDCECNRLSSLESDYAGSGFSGSFSAWLKWKHGTTISQSTIDTIKALCNGTYPCVFLPQPIVLPPVLQCRGDLPPVETCIDCGRYNAIKDSFYVKFGYHAPVANPTTDAEVNWNIAFENFANNETGFAKNWTEYVAFGNTCDTAGDYNCATLDSLLNAYKAQANPAVSVEVCRQQFVIFFNNFFHTAYTYEQWVNIFVQSCGHRPDVCKPTLTCSGLKSYLKSFYDTYGVQVYKNGNCSNLFTSFINNKMGTNLSYGRIDSLYQSLCGSSCLLEVCTFPNNYLLTRAYEKFRAEDMHPMDWSTDSCQIRFTTFFNTYFNPDPAWGFNDIHDEYKRRYEQGCVPNIDALCLPSYSCTTLNDVLIKFYNVYTYSIDSAYNCQDTFAIFFNDQLATNYTWQEISDIYMKICGVTLPACTPGIDCSDMQVVYNDFITNETYDSSNCRSLFTAYFNAHFGTSYTFEGIDSLFSVNCGTLISLCYITQSPPVNCDAITTLLNDFLVLYPNPQTQLGGNCEAVFAAFFNQRFGTAYQYDELVQYYYNVCGDTLNVCAGNCPRYISFYNDFNTRYGWMKLPLDLKKELFAQLFNDQFVTTGARLTFSEIESLTDTCIAGSLVTGPATQSVDDCEVLFSLKQAFYIMHPAGFGSGGGETGGGMEAGGGGKGDCGSDFLNWFNMNMGTSFPKYTVLSAWYDSICGPGAGIICPEGTEREIVIEDSLIMLPTNPPMLCGLSQPMFEPVPQDDDPCKDLPKIAYNAAMEKYELYLDSLRNVFDTAYYNKCMKAKDLESFTVSYKASEYHYTLYYYDQAGNLVKTVPPAGVDAKHADVTFLANVKTKRQNVRAGGAESSNILTPTHTLETEYRYNTLNQVIAQKTPDAGESKFWYDRLGRLVVSQNAKQYANARYSYTLYDELGRISQVGQKPQSTSMTETISRDPSQLATWLANNGASTNVQNKEEITRTVYDVSYFNGEATLSPAPLVQQHLRNRVSYRQVFDTEPTGSDDTKYAGTHRAATYYSYDIHGNVDTLLQDYNSGIMASTGNRYKKMVYDYDLISGKVNQVAYQPGAVDAYYHRYTYDGENRITDVETSHDGWIWEKDARYSYYKHGPLSRLILGQQQVQGLDYAYTLSGWLKGVNSTAVGDGTYDIGGDGKTGGGLSLVARDVFGFSLNYFTGDYRTISGVTPFATIGNGITHNGDGVQTGKDLFNGNIASMVVNLPKLGDAKVYGFRYDQLNRLKAMNAYNGLNNSTNSFSAITLDDYMERLTYDANGNILSYIRNGFGAGIAMNDYSYTYEAGSNRLSELYNSAGGGHSYSYEYDEIGNVTLDSKQGVDAAEWNLYGKLKAVTKSGTDIEYSYDAGGQRISKKVNSTEEWYVKDATGNIMATYIKATLVNSGHLSTKEFNKYGSDLLGTEKLVIDVQTPPSPPEIVTFERGITDYLLNDHRGNNMSMVTDKKLQHSTDGATIDYYLADVRTASYYSTYGAISKSFNDGQIDVAHNGQKRSTEISASAQTALFWEYDGDVGRRWNVDPKPITGVSEYSVFLGNPIYQIDVLGDSTPTSTKEAALARIDELSKNLQQSSVFKNVDPVSFVKDIKERVNNPSGLNQGDETYFCWAAAPLSYVYEKNPLGMVEAMFSLYNTGSFEYDNGTNIFKMWNPSSNIANEPGRKNNTFGEKFNKADQMLLLMTGGSFKSYLNIDQNYKPGDQNTSTWAGCTLSKAKDLWSRFGYEVNVQGGDVLWLSMNPGGAVMKSLKNSESVTLFINSPTFKRNEYWKNWTATHFIRIRSMIQVGDKYVVEYWDYGQWHKPFTIPVERFNSSMYGIISVPKSIK